MSPRLQGQRVATVSPSPRTKAATAGVVGARPPLQPRICHAAPVGSTEAAVFVCRSWEPERPPGFFGGVGDQDRFPAGMPFIPPLGPVVPPGGGGGMLIGPNHPGFFPGSGHAPGHPPQLPPGVPPGARYDPYGACSCLEVHELKGTHADARPVALHRPAWCARL